MIVHDHIATLSRVVRLEGCRMSLADTTLAAATLAEVLAELHQLANVFLPINRIPVELLVMIFGHAQGELGEQLSLGWGRFSSPITDNFIIATRRVVTLSHVCRHWRHIALEAPILWARIDGRNFDRFNTFMERARNVPLTLSLRSEGDQLVTFLGATSGRRVRRLDISLKQLTETAVAPLTTWVAPNLECLAMYTYQDSYADAAGTHLAPVQLLAGQTDALKGLALQYIGNWMPSNTFPSLTHLHLGLAFSTEAATSDILAVLANAPNLEFVHIGPLLQQHDTISSLPVSVVLSRLRRLTLVRFAYERAMTLVKHLSLPDHCFVCLDDLVVATPQEPGRLADVGPLHNATHLDFASGDDEMLLVADSATLGFWIRAKIEAWNTWDSWSHTLPTMITLSTITSLHINIYTTHTFWHVVLPQCSAVIELKVILGRADPDYTNPGDTFLSGLVMKPATLPSLRDLYVQGLYHTPNTESFLAALVALASFRAEQLGHRLRRFFIQLESSRSSSQIEHLHDAWPDLTAELANSVDEFDITCGGPELCEFKMRTVWQVDGAEKYFEPHPRDRPTRYYIPPSDSNR